MADQDFNINIRTIADTTGIKLTQQGLDSLKIAALQGNKEAIAALTQLTNAQKGVASAGSGNAAELGRLIGQFTGVGIAGGLLAFVSGLKQASAEIAKVAGELDKQGEQLLRHAQLQEEAARHAHDQSDILKISDATLKDIEGAQKKANELAGEEVGFWASISDYLQKQLLARQRAAQIGDYEAAQQKNTETAFDQLQAARVQGMREVFAAEKAINSTLQEKVATVEREIAAEEKAKQTAASNTDPGGYVKAANNLAKLRQEREKLAALEEQERQKQSQAQDQAYGAASPQAKAILENEKRARETGDEAFQKTADQLRKSASPADLAQVQAVIDSYGKPAPILSDVERNLKAFREGVGSQDFSGRAGPKQDARAREIEIQQNQADDEDLRKTNEIIKSIGGKPITKAEDATFKLKDAIDDLGRKFDRYWG